MIALLAVAAPPAASADDCPPGQEGTPPYCTPIAATLKVKLIKARPSGILLAVTVNLPGKVRIHGHGVRKKTRRVKVGRSKVKVVLTRKMKKKLRKKGKVKIRLTVAFTPDNGAATVTKKRTVVIRQHHRKKG